jgi:5,10-methenyltetrahydromethanopterin hydrogenase
MDQFGKVKQARDQRLHKEAETIRHEEVITQSIQTQETILRAFSSFVDYLDNRVGKTEVVNQLKTIGTPDAFRVVDALNSLHETLKTHENTDLTEVTAIMQAVLDEAKQIPKELPQPKDIVIPEAVDYSNQFKAMIGAVE